MNNEFIQPRYDAGGFANLPPHVVDMLTCGQYEAVVLLLVDGFGWRFFEAFEASPFLKWVDQAGSITRLTSQFPSTTAAHLTTLHSGKTVGEHGIFEWFYYEPAVDAVIAPLLFSFSGTPERDTLKSTGVKPKRILPVSTFYQALKKRSIPSTILQHREYTPSTYSNLLFSGATARGYKDLPEALINLALMLETSPSPAYFFLYFDKIDAVSHEYGPAAPQTEAEIQTFLLIMDQIFQKAMRRQKKKTLFLLTADHGQVDIDPQTTIYLNRDPRFKGLEQTLRTDAQGRLLVPAGSARDMFLYIKEGQIESAESILIPALAGRAEVRRVSEMIDQGYFGPAVSPAFQSRASDLVILPYRGESVWWYEKDHFEQRFRGHHGGLTKEEMEIPLLMWEMGK